MEQQVIDKFVEDVKACLAKASQMFSVDLSTENTIIDCNVRGTYGGWAHPKHNGKYRVRFNREAILKYNEEMTTDTIPHEVAHLVCFANPSLGKNHDAGWKRVCRMLGGDDSRTHEMVLTKAKQVPRYKYTMPNGREYMLAGKQHNGIQNGTRHYWCKHTKQELLPHYWEGYKSLRDQLATIEPPRFKMTAEGGMQRQPAPSTAGKTKMEIAKEVFQANPGISRRAFIDLMMVKAQMTEAGAGTYYYNLKKQK